jgi:phosphate transport system protein
MLKKLFAFAAGDEPIKEAEVGFTEMMTIVEELVIEASAVYWGQDMTPERRTEFYQQDVRVNQLERKVRKAVVTHLSGSAIADVPYSLMLMSLVKDLERLGDYAKNLLEVPTMSHKDVAERKLPDDEVVGELRQIANGVETLAREAPQIYNASDLERAQELTMSARLAAKRCDALISSIAAANYPGHIAVDLTLATRFYKRIQGHLLNLLSSVLMPLHKLDYYDEDEIPRD